MIQSELDLLHGYLDGTISDLDFAKLQTLLRDSAQARRTLRGLATVDAKLEELGTLNTRANESRMVQPPARALPHSNVFAWISVAATAACVVLAIIGIRFTKANSLKARSKVATAIGSAQEAIARLSVEPPILLPAWTSPTASLLEQPRISE